MGRRSMRLGAVLLLLHLVRQSPRPNRVEGIPLIRRVLCPGRMTAPPTVDRKLGTHASANGNSDFMTSSSSSFYDTTLWTQWLRGFPATPGTLYQVNMTSGSTLSAEGPPLMVSLARAQAKFTGLAKATGHGKDEAPALLCLAVIAMESRNSSLEERSNRQPCGPMPCWPAPLSWC